MPHQCAPLPLDPEHQAKKLVFRTEVNGSPKETVLDHAFTDLERDADEMLDFEMAWPSDPAPMRTMLCWPDVRRILRICETSESTL